MMNPVLQFVLNHETALALAASWLFSAACSTMPPLPSSAGYFITWLHNFLQAVAANINKLKAPKEGA